MPTTYEKLKALRVDDMSFSYRPKDVMLYALSVGMGRDPLDRQELKYVFEKEPLKVVPSLACVVSRTNLLLNAGLDRTKIVHGEQVLKLFRPLPPAADLLASSRVSAVHDKGEGKGVLIYVDTEVRDAATGEPLYALRQGTFARGDGGMGGDLGPAPHPHVMPTRKPDLVAASDTRADQALLYRLNGDMNPLHADPELAARVGFKAPILHGLCTYGVACREILAQVCEYDQTAIEEFNVRFTSPVYPGERITTQAWIDGDVVSFRCSVEARDKVVLDNGMCRVRRA
ncbi:MaoC/PaaZ C-terminal domain-containing protein [Ottowia thiooxydans]|uniref:MaoC/PaaZ C-terminal domain-containing protein n=1 Tax=Ottowia thiooxydans TaxID=219182 RepID=UPI0004228EC7|nr:MaoC/PaaZ C-terminal domain-containing protein [Ottowia thiooxydans]